MHTPETFGHLIRQLRNVKGLTLRELAKELAISHAYLSQVETNLAKPSEELARRLAQFFGADEEELLFLARDIPGQIQEIKEKYPRVAPAYFRRASNSEKRQDTYAASGKPGGAYPIIPARQIRRRIGGE